MTTNDGTTMTGTSTITRYLIEVDTGDGYIEMSGFSSKDRAEADDGYDTLKPLTTGVRMIELTTVTTVTETVLREDRRTE